MIAFLLEIAVRAAMIAAGTAVVLWALRIKTPDAKHTAWTAVVVAMLVLPISLTGGVRVAVPVLEPASPGAIDSSREAAQIALFTALPAAGSGESKQATQVSPQSSATTPTPAGQWSVTWSQILLGIYAFGALVLLLRLMIGTAQANRLRRSAVLCDGRLTTARCTTPITIGWLNPTLVLPEGWQHWSSAQLDAVLTHEHEHGRRRDPLVQWLALLNRAIFWVHPLAWWLERRLSTLAEEACDAAVIAAGHSPQDYSEYLLEMARAVSHERGRVRLVGMAMPGSGLSHRLRLIFGGLPMTRLSRTRIAFAIIFCASSSVLFASGTLVARTLGPIARTFGHDIQLAADQRAFGSTPATPASAEVIAPPAADTASLQKFDLVSIKPCPRDAEPPPGRSGGWPKRAQVSADLARWECLTVGELAVLAYASPTTGNGLLNYRTHASDAREPVRGGPSWTRSERFTIEAKAGAAMDQKTMTGPMLRALLEDRFQLKTHRATEDQPAYVLTVTPKGLDMARVKPTSADDCVVRVPGAPLPPRGGAPLCGGQDFVRGEGGAQRVRWTGTTFQDFLNANGGLMDRFVVDKTGLNGRYNIEFDFIPDDRTPGYPWPLDSGTARTGLSVFKALEAIGLHLEPSKAPAEYLVVDRVERPKPNGPDAPARAQGAGTPVPAMQIKFEAVSIRPCEPGTPTAGARGGGAGGMRNAITPGYATWGCVSLSELIDQAYGGGPFPKNSLLNTIRVPPGLRLDLPKRIKGGPDWVEKEKFAIEIRLSGDTTDLTGPARHNAVLTAMAPALQAMLEDRFQLKIRKATEERPMYALALAAGGLKVTKADLNKCYTVTAEERAAAGRMGPPPPPGFEDSLPCGEDGSRIRSRGAGPGNVSLQFTHISMKAFAQYLSENLDRYVLDKTGVDGSFNLTLDYSPDEFTPGDTDHAAMMAEARRQLRPDQVPTTPVKGNGPTIFKALESLGLTLQKTRGPAEYLLIDSAQRPKQS